MKKVLNFLVPYLKSKYVITFMVFFVWMLFFDRNDIFTQMTQRSKLNVMKQDKEYFLKEIERNQAIMDELENNPEALEKFAREEYFMKKDDEDIFIVTHTDDDT